MLEQAIAWFEARKGKVTYSMAERRGPSSYDCSSSVYYALIQASIFPVGIYIGNTDSLFGDLERHGWVQLQPNAQGNFDTQRGDVFIWGTRGNSNGGLGHTGMFENANDIIHCSYGYNGIAVSNYDWLHSINGTPPQTFYRYSGSTPAPANNPTDQVVEIGSFVKFDKVYTVNDVQDISDVWQVRTTELCPSGFTWADNGIPAAGLTEIDGDGFATTDQELAIGSSYKIPGKFQVSDVGATGDRWLAQIEYSGLKFWVDLETAIEVDANDPGTPTPGNRPAPPAPQPDPVPTPPTPDPVVPAPVPDPTPEPQPTHPDGTPIPAPADPSSVPTPNPAPATPQSPTIWYIILKFLLGFIGVKL